MARTRKYRKRRGGGSSGALNALLSKARGRSRSVGVAGGMRRRHRRSSRYSRSRRHMRGGWSQYQNNMPVDNVYSLGGKLSPSMVGMANPPPISGVQNQAIDNLNHNALNSYGNSGAGMGSPSRGW